MVPKPNRTDPSLPKNYRPIALLKTLGKLLEKVVTRRIYYDMMQYALIPTNQFGGRDASSTTDAGLALVHDIAVAWDNGLVCASLLFDIQGFFDNINHDRLVHTFQSLGFPLELTRWLHSFLSDRSIRLRFNGFTSDPISILVGSPQGSPISPVLSIIYTYPLLLKVQGWINSGLSMYVDDGNILACGASYEAVNSCLQYAYAECEDWLTRAGLGIEPNKTELIYFVRPHSRTERPSHIFLPMLSHSTYYKVAASDHVRYLGFHLDHKLQWQHHVTIMTNRAKSALKSLQLLGNSVRGLDFMRWRLAYNAICLPILTYGIQLWYRGQVGLVKQLQGAQNEAVRVITGAFKMAPREPLHQLIAILPFDLRIQMLMKNSALRLYRLPRESQLLKRLGGPWSSPREGDLPLPCTPARNRRVHTRLTALAQLVPPDGPRLRPHALPPWGGWNWGNHLTQDTRVHQGEELPPWIAQIKAGMALDTMLTLFCRGALSNHDREDDRPMGVTSVVVYLDGKELAHSERQLGATVSEFDAELAALESGALLAQSLLVTQPHLQITLLCPNPSAISAILNVGPHPGQRFSLSFKLTTDNLLSHRHNLRVAITWAPQA